LLVGYTALSFSATGSTLAARRIFASESAFLMPSNVGNEVISIHRSQLVLKILSPHTKTFLASAEADLIYLLKLFCRNI
jgi:hypothetical protein